MLRCSHETACEAPDFCPKVFLHPLRVEAEMIATKVGYLATGLAFFFVGAVAMGLI